MGPSPPYALSPPRFLRFVAFGVAISAAAAVVRLGCDSDPFAAHKAGRTPPLRPPDWVFGVVWPCLYATTGATWAISGPQADVPIGLATGLGCLWLVVYVCARRRRLAAGVLSLLCLATAHAASVLRPSPPSSPSPRLLLLPLVGWTAFATYLNAYGSLFSRTVG